jgi:hypothetical protein
VTCTKATRPTEAFPARAVLQLIRNVLISAALSHENVLLLSEKTKFRNDAIHVQSHLTV